MKDKELVSLLQDAMLGSIWKSLRFACLSDALCVAAQKELLRQGSLRFREPVVEAGKGGKSAGKNGGKRAGQMAPMAPMAPAPQWSGPIPAADRSRQPGHTACVRM